MCEAQETRGSKFIYEFGRNSPPDCFYSSNCPVRIPIFTTKTNIGVPKKRKLFWGEEEQRNERGVTFYKRIKESRHKRYEACDDDGADVGIRTPEASLKTYTISNRAPSASSDTSANIALIL